MIPIKGRGFFFLRQGSTFLQQAYFRGRTNVAGERLLFRQCVASSSLAPVGFRL